MKSAHPSRLLLLPIRSRAAQIAVAGLTVTMLCPAALAAIGALDTFSSQDSGGGTGWAAPWSEGGTYDDGLITGLGDCETKAYAVDFNYATRSMSAGYAPATTPEVWAAVYLRPMANTGWQFGFELGTGLGGNSTRGAQIGRMLGDGRYAGGRSNAEGTTFLPTTFTAGTATLLVIRLYRDTPAATTYNRADYLADVDGSDGRANALITIATGINLATRAAPVVDQIRLMSDGQTTNFDYVAIGTTQAEVLDPVPDSALFWGGTGSWDTVTANWEDAGGSAVAWVPLSDAVFPGEGGEIPLSGTIRASSLSFKAPGYQLTGGTLTLSGTAAGIFTAGTPGSPQRSRTRTPAVRSKAAPASSPWTETAAASRAPSRLPRAGLT